MQFGTRMQKKMPALRVLHNIAHVHMRLIFHCLVHLFHIMKNDPNGHMT